MGYRFYLLHCTSVCYNCTKFESGPVTADLTTKYIFEFLSNYVVYSLLLSLICVTYKYYSALLKYNSVYIYIYIASSRDTEDIYKRLEFYTVNYVLATLR